MLHCALDRDLPLTVENMVTPQSSPSSHHLRPSSSALSHNCCLQQLPSFLTSWSTSIIQISYPVSKSTNIPHRSFKKGALSGNTFGINFLVYHHHNEQVGVRLAENQAPGLHTTNEIWSNFPRISTSVSHWLLCSLHFIRELVIMKLFSNDTEIRWDS